ncbi:hypothetical protein ES695_14490 [Candidatus Atribacteria bacterium 1244-E10-H5-B2]|nr:MAG: hypothetical protein ES695_14490 [Candidatus Atribacteria bacterium 1244-E10-H5-B2]
MNTREEIISLLSKNEKPLGPKTIALELKKSSVNIRKILSNLCREGKIERVIYGKYISLEISEQWHKDNPEYAKQYYKNNLEKVRKYHNQYNKDRDKIDLKFNLNRKIEKAIRLSLRGNKAGWRWESLTGYTLADLIKRLNKTMPEGHTWKDFLSGELHIDHIIPIDAFNFTRPEHTDFKRCWELENLQLLPARKNLIKHTKLSKPFQPALRI